MFRKFATLFLLSLLSLSAVAAAPAEFTARLQPADRERGPMPVSITGSANTLLRLLGIANRQTPCRARVLEGDREIPAQWERQGERVTLTWLADGVTPAGRERRFRVRVEAGATGEDAGGVAVTETPASVVVQTPFLRVTHPRTANGGLPSALTFLPEGGTFTDFDLNDRLYRAADKQGFWLRYDRKPEVTVESSGPVRTVVRVRARYLDAKGAAPESGPTATYRFFYYAGTPVVQVQAEVTQEKPATWSQLHLLEWNFKHDFFNHWAVAPSAGATPTLQAFTATKKNVTGQAWGALVNDKAALAMAAGQHSTYDDKDGYGRYLHGPWLTEWSGEPRWFAATLYAGPAEAKAEALAQRVLPYLPVGGTAAVTLEVPALAGRLERAAARLAGGDTAGRWLLRRARAAAGSLDTLAEAEALLARVEARPAGKQGARAGVTVEEMPGLLLVSDGVLGLGFRREGAGWRLCSLYHAATDHEFMESLSSPAPLWEARFRGADGKAGPALAGGPATLTVDRSRLPKEAVLRLSWPGEPRVEATATLRAGTGLSTWRATVGGRRDGQGLWELDFPVIPGLGSRTRPQADVLAVPRSWGQLHPNPKGSGTRITADYPSASWSMQYALLYHGESGLYLAAQDPAARSKRFSVTHQPDAAGGSLSWRITHYPPDMGKPGTGLTLPYDCAIGVYRGDWYEGSRLYRKWALTTPWMAAGPLAKRKDVGTAIRPLALWMQGGGAPEQFVPAVKRFQDYFGVPMGVHWYNWHQIPFDNDYPHYFPTKPGFREGVAELKARGVVVMPYINGRLWDTDTQDWPEAKAHAAQRPEGDHYVEVYGSGEKLAPMCPATAAWQSKVKETVLRLVREEGVSGVYLDQITASKPALCFNPAHGHPLGGGDHWWTGYRKMLREMRAELSRTHPEAFLTSENNSEPWVDLLEGHLTWMPLLGRFAPMYTAVYGGYTYPYGRATSRGCLENGHAAAMQFATQFLWGGQLGWLGTTILDEKYRAEAEYLRLLAQSRAKNIAYLAEGEMLKAPRLITDVPQLTARTVQQKQMVEDTMPAVLTAAWRAADGSVAFFLTNLSKEPQRFTWEIDLGAHRLGKAASLKAQEGAGQAERITGARVRREETLPGRGLRVFVARPIP